MTMCEAQIGYPGWRVAAAASAGVFVASLAVVTLPVLLKALAGEFGWSREQVATAFAIAAATAALGAAPLGVLLDRVATRRVAVPCLCVFGVAFASLGALTPHRAHLYATFAVLGAAGIGTSPVAYGRTISAWFGERRGLALAVVVAGGALGGVVHPPAMSALAATIGWRWACVAIGVLVLALAVPFARRNLREAPPSAATAAAAAPSISLRRGLRTRVFWILLVGMVGGTMVQNAVIVHLHSLLTDRGASDERAALAMSVMALAAVAGRLATGALIDRRFAPRVGLAMMAVAACGAWWLATADGYGTALCAACLVGFGTGGEADIVPFLLARYFGLGSLATLYGVAWLAGGIGGGIGPIAMGRTFDQSGSYAGALSGLAVTAAIAAASMLLLPRYAAPATTAAQRRASVRP